MLTLKTSRHHPLPTFTHVLFWTAGSIGHIVPLLTAAVTAPRPTHSLAPTKVYWLVMCCGVVVVNVEVVSVRVVVVLVLLRIVVDVLVVRVTVVSVDEVAVVRVVLAFGFLRVVVLGRGNFLVVVVTVVVLSRLACTAPAESAAGTDSLAHDASCTKTQTESIILDMKCVFMRFRTCSSVWLYPPFVDARSRNMRVCGLLSPRDSKSAYRYHESVFGAIVCTSTFKL